jgi:quercetin dioxygenase-like cupin family protein
MFAVWGNPNEGASLILQKFPAGMDSGWHWHTAAYQGVVIQGKFTHTFEGAAPQTGGPGSVWSQPARQVHDDKCEEGGDCIIAVYFHDKLDLSRWTRRRNGNGYARPLSAAPTARLPQPAYMGAIPTCHRDKCHEQIRIAADPSVATPRRSQLCSAPALRLDLHRAG